MITFSHRKGIHTSQGSHLEAFSAYHNGRSMAALHARATAQPDDQNNSSSRTALLYSADTTISRVKLTCLTTV